MIQKLNSIVNLINCFIPVLFLHDAERVFCERPVGLSLWLCYVIYVFFVPQVREVVNTLLWSLGCGKGNFKNFFIWKIAEGRVFIKLFWNLGNSIIEAQSLFKMLNPRRLRQTSSIKMLPQFRDRTHEELRQSRVIHLNHPMCKVHKHLYLDHSFLFHQTPIINLNLHPPPPIQRIPQNPLL